MKVKQIATLTAIAVFLIIGLICLPNIIDTVEKGTYQIKQAAVTGIMDAKMSPGLWGQWFGDIDVWPKAETYFFTSDNDTKGDVDADTSIEVRFNDGSMCRISGTARIIMPTTKGEAIALVTERGHKTYADVQEKLIKPTIRSVLRSTANLMSARESYSEKRLDYITWSKDQIENGIYKTFETKKQVEDLITGEKTWKKVKEIKEDGGVPLHEVSPLAGTGIKLVNFEIKSFVYEKKVQEQISKQQQARMAVETAKAKAEEAKQDELKAIAEGKKNVAIAKYQKEEEKIRAVVDAEKDKETATIAGQKRKDVAALDRDAAKLEKERLILLGEGEATRKRAVMSADGALQQKLATYERVNRMYASAIENYKGNWVPTTMFGGGESVPGGGANALIDMLTAKTAMDLNLNMEMKNKQ